MAYFPSIGPFYDPEHEQEVYGGSDGRLRARHLSSAERRNFNVPKQEQTFSSSNSPRDKESSDSVHAKWTPYISQNQGDVYYIDAERSKQSDRREITDSYLHFQRFASDSKNSPKTQRSDKYYQSTGSPRQDVHSHSGVSSHRRAVSGQLQGSPRDQRTEHQDSYRIEELTELRQSRKDNHSSKTWKDENFNDQVNNSDIGDKFERHGIRASSDASGKFDHPGYGASTDRGNQFEKQDRGKSSESGSPFERHGSNNSYGSVSQFERHGSNNSYGSGSQFERHGSNTKNESYHGYNGSQFERHGSKTSNDSGSQFERHGSREGWEEHRMVESRKIGDIERCKEIVLMPDFRQVQREDGGVVLCEKLFGIILFQYNHKPGSGRSQNTESRDVLKDRKVIVQGLVPRSAAERSGKIHRGDMLISLDDIEINWLNIDKLFQFLRRKQTIKLTLQSPVIVGPKPPVPPRPRFPRQDIYRRVTECSIRDGQRRLSGVTYTVMYLTLIQSSEDVASTNDDVVYVYPPDNNKLVDVRGLFLTLSSSLVDITNFTAKNSSVQIQNNVVHLAYCSENKDVLVLGLPADRVPISLLNQLLADLVRLLTFMFGGLSRAFRDCDKEQLDQLFALTFHHLLTPVTSPDDLPSSSAFLSALSAVRTLCLPQEYELICDEILSEFEAADFDEYMEVEDLSKRRPFTILGSSLYYKNYEVCSHMLTSDSAAVHLYLHHHCLLQLLRLQSVDEVVIWHEVWPLDRSAGLPGYNLPESRCFMLLVGMKHFLLCCLLEMGGCTRWDAAKVSPPPLYVDQAKATLLQLETDDVDMAAWCQEWLLSDSGSVSLVGAERYLAKSKSSKDDSILMSPLKPTGSPKMSPIPMRTPSDSVFKYRSSPLADRKPGQDRDVDRISSTEQSTPVMMRQGSKLSYGSNDSGGSGSSTGAPKSKSSRKSFQNDMSSISKSLSGLQVEEIPIHGGHHKITRGQENALFHYVQLYDVEGVYVMPTDYDLAAVQGAIHCHLLENFYRCSLGIRGLFSEQNSIQELAMSKSHPRFGVNSTLLDLEEHGVLFRHASIGATDSKKNHTPLSYWVVGRRFPLPNQRELYVCFHESASQNLVEMAFKLGFGITGSSS